jgi:orotidine-5'-phosphate decarboxylase
MNRIIFPLDGKAGESFQSMQDWGIKLRGKIAFVKVGLKAFTTGGPTAIKQAYSAMKVPIMLDLKLHDIPNTMREATEEVIKHREIGGIDIRLLTVHAAAGKKALEDCVEVCDKTGLEIVAVTQLTSLPLNMAVFIERVEIALKAGVRAFVCSPNEARIIRDRSKESIIITPGIRLAGDNKDDQVRVNTPYQAINNGADYVVVGRSIRLAENPTEVAHQINKEASAGFLARIG